MARTILQPGALPNAGDAYGNTPLSLAVFCRRDLVAPLLLAGADLRLRGVSAGKRAAP